MQIHNLDINVIAYREASGMYYQRRQLFECYSFSAVTVTVNA